MSLKRFFERRTVSGPPRAVPMRRLSELKLAFSRIFTSSSASVACSRSRCLRAFRMVPVVPETPDAFE